MPISVADPLLSVKSLHADYGNIPVLHNIGLMIRPGEAVALLGPNGAGKTTLLRAISGLLYGADGKLPQHVQAFVDEIKRKVELQDTTLWWVLIGADAINLIADAVRQNGSTPAGIEGWWNQQVHYPGLYANYRFTDGDHNGFPSNELVMSQADSGRDGAFALAPS